MALCGPILCRDGPVWSYTLLRGSSVALHVAEMAMIILRESSVVLYCATRVLYGASLCLDSQHNERPHPGLVLHFAVVLKMSCMFVDSLCREVL